MSVALPPALAPWAKWLALFPDELAHVMGDLTARLALLLGAGAEREDERGVPDGLGGIARRGTYDRLLTTEWLLHDEAPDEFMRRAVSGEHVFLETSFRRASSSKRTLVLLDAGPDQLGAPRIVQLALLIALAARAERHRAGLSVGVLQDEGGTLYDRIDRRTLEGLLARRAATRVSSADLDRWREVEGQGVWSESWLVGRVARFDARAWRVDVAEVLEPLRRAVKVEVLRPRAARPRAATLDLPSPQATVRLLRDPLAAHTVTTRGSLPPLDPAAGFLFSADGRLLLTRTEAGALCSVPIPNAPRAVAPRAAILPMPEGHRLLAVGQARARKRLVLLTASLDSLFVHHATKGAKAIRWSERVELAAPPSFASDGALLPLGVMSANMLAVAGEVELMLRGPRAELAPASAVASKATADRLVYVRPMRGGWVTWAARMEKGAPVSTQSRGLPPPAAPPFFFGAMGTDELLAWREGPDVVLFVAGQRRRVRAVDGQLVGVLDRGLSSSEPAALVVAADRRRLVLRGATADVLAVTSSPIAYAASSDSSRHVVYCTEAGELGVYSLGAGGLVLQMAVEPSA